MEEKKNKTFELILGEEELTDGVSTISFVEFPAHESNFMFFNKEENKYKFAKDGEKMMVFGAALIPNQKILRLDENENQYHVFFSKETIEKSQELFFKRSQNNSSNIEHLFAIDGVSVVESWIVENTEQDKSKALGFSGFPVGSWIVGYKVDNEQLWEGIKDGSVKGFSIEGQFIEELVKMNKPEEEIIETDRTLEIETIITNDKLSDEEKYDAISDLIKKN